MTSCVAHGSYCRTGEDLRGSMHKFQARRRAILSLSLRQKNRQSKVGDRRDNSAMSVPAGFSGVRL